MSNLEKYLFRVRTIKKGKKYTIQKHCRFGNAKKQALKNYELRNKNEEAARWVEGLIGKTWYELKI